MTDRRDPTPPPMEADPPNLGRTEPAGPDRESRSDDDTDLTRGSETQGSETQGSETQGSETQGSELARALKLTPDRWVDVADDEWVGPIGILAGAWVLIAWSRLGLQGLAVPRIALRFLLIGFYGWIGLIAVIWLVHRLTERGNGAPKLDRVGLAKVAARAHQPIVLWAFLVQFLQILPLPLLSTLLALFAFLFWMPGQLVAGVAGTHDLPIGRAAVPVLAGWLAWMASIGWYLYLQLSHLL